MQHEQDADFVYLSVSDWGMPSPLVEPITALAMNQININ